jgi:osmotically-inducible protein OsmY
MAAALLLLTVAACGGIRAAPEPPIANFEAYLIELQNAYPPGYVIQCLGTPLDGRPATIRQLVSTPEGQAYLPVPVSHQECRDTIIQSLMVAIDLRYQQFELGFFETNRQMDFGSNLAVIGLGTAGAFVSGGTSQILSGVSAAVAGTREAFTKTVLAEQTSVALLTAMRARRDQIKAQILSRLRLSASEYPLGMALGDVSGYYRAGTIVGALTGVTEAVSTERVQAQQNLQATIHDHEFVPAVPGSNVTPAPASPASPPAGPQSQPPGRACPAASQDVVNRKETMARSIGARGIARDETTLTKVYNALAGSGMLREAAKSLAPDVQLTLPPPKTPIGKVTRLNRFLNRVVCTLPLLEEWEKLANPLLR